MKANKNRTDRRPGEREKHMKKAEAKTSEMRAEYDFSKGVRLIEKRGVGAGRSTRVSPTIFSRA